jgi:hypothetical protein
MKKGETIVLTGFSTIYHGDGWRLFGNLQFPIAATATGESAHLGPIVQWGNRKGALGYFTYTTL